MMSVLWYPMTISLAIIGAGWLYNILGSIISANSASQSVWISELGNSFVKSSYGDKILIFGILTLAVLVLPLCCKLDENFRELPGGDFFEMHLGESPFEELWFLRLIPGVIFLTYLAFRMAVTTCYPDVVFDIQQFSLIGENYNGFQWITQISYFLTIASLIFLVFDSFVSAGFVGGIIHMAVVVTANFLSFVLAFVILITLMASIPSALFVIILSLVVSVPFLSLFKAIRIAF